MPGTGRSGKDYFLFAQWIHCLPWLFSEGLNPLVNLRFFSSRKPACRSSNLARILHYVGGALLHLRIIIWPPHKLVVDCRRSIIYDGLKEVNYHE